MRPMEDFCVILVDKIGSYMLSDMVNVKLNNGELPEVDIEGDKLISLILLKQRLGVYIFSIHIWYWNKAIQDNY